MGLSEFLYRLFVLPIYDLDGRPTSESAVFAKVQYLSRFLVYSLLSSIIFSAIYASSMYLLYIFSKYVFLNPWVFYDLREYSYKGASVLALISSLFSFVCCNVDVNQIMDMLEDKSKDPSLDEYQEYDDPISNIDSSSVHFGSNMSSNSNNRSDISSNSGNGNSGGSNSNSNINSNSNSNSNSSNKTNNGQSNRRTTPRRRVQL